MNDNLTFRDWLAEQAVEGADKQSQVEKSAIQAASQALIAPDKPGETPEEKIKSAIEKSTSQTLQSDPNASLQDIEDAVEIANKLGNGQGGQPAMMKKRMKSKMKRKMKRK